MNSSIEKNTFPLELMNWYLHKGYDFPWRNTSDPYSIWLSEVMLQQTRVSTASPYYQRWISALPDIHSVAETPIDNILKLWEGHGYYGRARNFHTACIIIIEKHGEVWSEETGNVECTLDDILVIIGWTSPFRFEWFKDGEYYQSRLWKKEDIWKTENLINCFDKFNGEDVFTVTRNGMLLSVIRKIN